MLRKLFWPLLIIAVIIFIAAAYFTGNIPFVGQQSSTPVVPPPVTNGQPASANIGQAIGFGDWGYRVSSLERRDKLETESKALLPDGSFVIVHLTVTNNGKEPRSLAAGDFALVDGLGRRYGVDTDATDLAGVALNKSKLLGAAIQPGLSKGSVLVFDVPGDAKGLSFRLFQGYLDVNLGQ
ncbi:MAG: DUF4352 domain-containing protein [Dehalococcoidia bacterium]|nr:DUF4352 domain-containing protein [Dehalococcoidia bacterium]